MTETTEIIKRVGICGYQRKPHEQTIDCSNWEPLLPVQEVQTVHSTNGLSFRLGKFMMQELGDAEPYILLRGALGEALAIIIRMVSTLWFTSYVIGNNIGQYKAEVELTPGQLRIGCVIFKGADAEIVKAWALKK